MQNPFAKTCIHFLATLALLAMPLGLSTTVPASADRGQVLRLNADGNYNCNAIDASRNGGWTGKVRGNLGDGGERGPSPRFQVRDCFKSRTRCETFVNRIENIIRGVTSVHYRRCTPR